VVVDFCCGSGHLGIVIAYLVSNVTVILVDNKEESLRRARERVEKLDLKNIMIVHSNLDYFKANFQVNFFFLLNYKFNNPNLTFTR